MSARPQIRVYSSRVAAAQALSAAFVRAAERALAGRDRFTVALAGGNSPREAYQMIANEYASDVDWLRTHVFWGDERMVPPHDPQSNAHMAREALLNHVPIPSNHIHRIMGEHAPEEAAAAYNDELQHHFRGSTPRFDLILLGMGADGHVASMFPGTAALNETKRYAVANHVPSLDAWRVTLTLPVINNASQVIIYVLGEDKGAMIKHVLGETVPEGEIVPAQLVNPLGELMWILDEAAGAHLRM